MKRHRGLPTSTRRGSSSGILLVRQNMREQSPRDFRYVYCLRALGNRRDDAMRVYAESAKKKRRRRRRRKKKTKKEKRKRKKKKKERRPLNLFGATPKFPATIYTVCEDREKSLIAVLRRRCGEAR